MSPFTESVVGGLTEALAGTLFGAGSRRLRRALEDPERKQALDRCCEVGILALIRASAEGRESEGLDHLRDVISKFFTSKDIADDLGRALAPLLRGQPLDMDEMRELFEEAGYDAETLPGFDFEGAITAFAGGFAAAAVEQPVLGSEIRTHLLLEQLKLQSEMRDSLQELVGSVLQAKPEPAVVSAEQITADNVAGTQIFVNVQTTPTPPAGPDAEENDEAAGLRDCYLRRILADAGFLALSGVDPSIAGSEADAPLRLDAVYTALLTQAPQEIEKLAHRAVGTDPTTKRPPSPSSALEQLNCHSRLVLLGDPGSGKSTFANFVALCLAGELLGDPRANLALLTVPLPSEKSDEEESPPLAWDPGPLLPVRVVLRDFAARGLPDMGEPGTAEALWLFLEGELKRAANADYAPHLKRTLKRDGGLILLDGLDEVPEAEGRRQQILEAVHDFVATFSKCRFLVTCRTYAYQHQEWRLSGFSEAILESLNEAQIRRFIDLWYAHVAQVRGLETADAQGRAELLKSAIFDSDRLKPLAERPLLLTLMASLHAWRGGSLPDRREELYHDAVQLLLDFWEQRRVVHDAEGRPIVQQESLAEWLSLDRARVRRVLNEIAYDAHASQPDLAGTADIAEDDLVGRLMKASGSRDLKPARLVEFLRDRAGLLLARGVGVYAFPHRTFQEYLAACHLTDHHGFPEHLADLARGDKERWREVTLLASAKSARGAAANPWNLADALCYQDPGNAQRSDEDVHGAHLAGLVLAESADLSEAGGRLGEKLDRIRAWQVDLLSAADLPAHDRAECGRTLARLRDPRDEVTSVEGIQVCRVPKGPFWMGSETKSRGVILPETPASKVDLDHDFWIGRFPVTQEQFQAFAAAGGYQVEPYWPEAISAGIWRDGKLETSDWLGLEHRTSRSSAPMELPQPFGLPNHPVVGVSWFEARAFCRWLTDRLRQQGRLPENRKIDLPNELDWEKAARGGFVVPSMPRIVSVAKASSVDTEDILAENPELRRSYPWGEEDDAEHGNWRETGIGTTSAVGCFPKGRSPYGGEELSGNVWEWTRSRPAPYPHPEDPEDRSEHERFDGAAGFVLRGGGFGSVFDFARCAARDVYDPSLRSDDIGFRVMLSPSGL